MGGSGHALGALRETAETVAARRRELNEWCAWRKRRTQAMDLDLAPLVQAIEQGRVPVAEIPETFEAAYCNWWSRVIGEGDVLRTFSRPEHTATIDKFQEVTAGRTSQWGILRHELQKKSKHKPTRL